MRNEFSFVCFDFVGNLKIGRRKKALHWMLKCTIGLIGVSSGDRQKIMKIRELMKKAKNLNQQIISS